jgi:hypothetical protein
MNGPRVAEAGPTDLFEQVDLMRGDWLPPKRSERSDRVHALAYTNRLGTVAGESACTMRLRLRSLSCSGNFAYERA